MSSEKWEESDKINKKNVIKFSIGYLLVLILIYLGHPKFDSGFLMFLAVYLVFGLFIVFYNLKYPEKVRKIRESYEKRTPKEIAQHVSGMYIYTAKVVGVAIIMMVLILVIFMVIFLSLNK